MTLGFAKVYGYMYVHDALGKIFQLLTACMQLLYCITYYTVLMLNCAVSSIDVYSFSDLEAVHDICTIIHAYIIIMQATLHCL